MVGAGSPAGRGTSRKPLPSYLALRRLTHSGVCLLGSQNISQLRGPGKTRQKLLRHAVWRWMESRRHLTGQAVGRLEGNCGGQQDSAGSLDCAAHANSDLHPPPAKLAPQRSMACQPTTLRTCLWWQGTVWTGRCHRRRWPPQTGRKRRAQPAGRVAGRARVSLHM